MGIRVGINGFGRIGRAVLRLAFEKYGDIEIVAVNDLVPAQNLAYLLKYDSVHGRFSLPIESDDEAFIIDERHTVHVLAEMDPSKLPWKELNVDYVIESTGLFTQREKAELHLQEGANTGTFPYCYFVIYARNHFLYC